MFSGAFWVVTGVSTGPASYPKRFEADCSQIQASLPFVEPWYAYLVASAACVSLLGYYLSYVLKGKFNGLLFASLLTALYGALYGILASEDNALVMGSLLVFSLLALVMITTRKVDWYTISSKPELPQTHSAYDIS